MARSIESDRGSFLEVLLKLIPSEIIAVHVFVQGVMPRVFAPTLVVFLLLVGITPLYLYWAMGVRSRPQLLVSTLSLVVWIYALGQGPFRFMHAPWWQAWYGSVLLALWTLVPPMFLTRAKPAAAPAPARVAAAQRPRSRSKASK
jgi:hypothetical protein